ncbi:MULTISPECIES: P-loop NTPase fold protein [unclassified Clostridium]|uniref:P-loop NTPase fold protein n=1 Tax=unclassified Clostridium TaxID=2614128 RepID=UPI00207A8A0D|nr:MULTISPECIES: P-loop NTPase fold protein [unclassified Clostridium]
MYNADKPIEKFEDDILGRKFFSDQLAQAVLSINSNDNITIGLYGKWGTGKTSILNLAINEIINLIQDVTIDKRPIILKFEPWNFTNNDNLITQFFKQLKNELKLKENTGFSKSLGEALGAYSEAIEFAEAIPYIGKYASLLKMSAKFAGNRLKSNNLNISISNTKDKLVKELKKQNKKIIVIIDDIDRLSNEQIRMVFQLVNQVAGLPNIIYLLSMDKEVVVRALEKVQECDGEEYLEKIVQVPFSIPKLDKERVHNLFFYKLDEIMEKKENVFFDMNYWGTIYQKCINPFLNTIRDVNRIINTFQFKYNFVADEVNFVDMIAITVLQVLKPDIYQWIIEHESIICGSSYDYRGISYSSQEMKKKKYIEELSEAGGEKALEVISAIFPRIDREVNYYYKSIQEDELRKQQRIADVDRFKIYFSLDISDIAVSHNTIVKSVNKMEIQEFQDLFLKLNIDKKVISYLKELRSYSDEVPTERIPFLIKVLYQNMHSFVGEVRKSIVSFSAQKYAEWCITSLFKRVETQEKRYDIYVTTIYDAEFNALVSMASDINRIELSYGRLAGKGNNIDEKNQSISIQQLEFLEKIYVSRIRQLLNEHCSIFQCDKLFFIVYLWKSFEKNSCVEYFNNLLEDPISILKFIIRMSSEWTGSGDRGWTFMEDNYKEFISKEKIIQTIEKYCKGDILVDFSDEEQAKLASFILNINSGEFEHVAEREAMQLVAKWNLEKQR